MHPRSWPSTLRVTNAPRFSERLLGAVFGRGRFPFFRMKIEFKIEFVVKEGRPFSGGGSGPAARGVEADDSSLEDSIQGPVFPVGRQLSPGAGIDSFDKEPSRPAGAQEQPAAA